MMDDKPLQANSPWHASSVAHMFVKMGTAYRGLIALNSHPDRDGNRQSFSYDQVVNRALAIAEGLIYCGLQAGERIMILADNRVEWLVSSMATTFAGAVDVPRGNDATHDEVNYIVSHSASRFLIVETRSHLERVLRSLDDWDNLERVVVMEGRDLTPDQQADPQILTLDELETMGVAVHKEGKGMAESRITAIKPEDPYTMIYTSGTTGRPKGVVLTHANMLSQVANVPIPINPEWKVLSILPIWHSYERAFELIALARGVDMTYSTIKTIGADMREIKPHIMVSAPRLWENVYSRIMHNIRSSGVVKRGLFRAAYFFAWMANTAMAVMKDEHLELRKINKPERWARKAGAAFIWILVFLPWRLFDKLVFSKLRQVIGGRFVFTVSGGGALPLHIDQFFNYIGIRVLEGYGMTESSPVLSVRLIGKLVIGTVGPPYPQTELRIVDPETKELIYPNPELPHEGRGIKGEIHVRGPQVMQGYFRSPEETARVIHDGWLNTGDLGIMSFNDCLKIVGRTKDTVVLLSGENIEPVPIENRIIQTDCISNCMVVGQDEKYLGLLVIPSVEGFSAIRPEWDSIEKIMECADARHWVDDYLHETISARNGFKSFERIHFWRWIPKPFEVGEEITSTFKLKRHVITEKYRDIIETMYKHETRR